MSEQIKVRRTSYVVNCIRLEIIMLYFLIRRILNFRHAIVIFIEHVYSASFRSGKKWVAFAARINGVYWACFISLLVFVVYFC